jgi:hypothetical protein
MRLQIQVTNPISGANHGPQLTSTDQQRDAVL